MKQVELLKNFFQQFIWFQACDTEDDGLFGFDLHSDGDGQRCAFLIFFLVPFYGFVRCMIRNVSLEQAFECWDQGKGN